MTIERDADQNLNDVLWASTPSHWAQAGYYVGCGVISIANFTFVSALPLMRHPTTVLAAWTAVPLIFAAWRWLEVHLTRRVLTCETLTIRTGVLRQRIETLETFRVKDLVLDRPAVMRMAPGKLGNLTLITSDISTPTTVLTATPNSIDVMNLFRGVVDDARRRKGTREIDY